MLAILSRSGRKQDLLFLSQAICVLLSQIHASANAAGSSVSKMEPSPAHTHVQDLAGHGLEASAQKPGKIPQGNVEVARIQAELNSTRDFNKALDSLQNLLKRESRNVEAHMMCGKVLQHLGYEGLADEQFRIADQLDPGQPDSVLSLFRNKLQREGPMAAYEYLQYVQRRFPRDPSVLVMQGLMEAKRGDATKAEFYYRDALDSNPNTPGLGTWMALLRLQQGKYEEAIEFADRDLKLKPDSSDACLIKGRALVFLHRYEQAIPFLQSALKGAYDRRTVADILSRAFISNGQYGEAIEPTLICLAYTPMKERSAVDQLKTRLFVILKRVNAKELINSLSVVRRDIPLPDQMANVYFACGATLDKDGKAAEAEEAFIEGIKLNPYKGRPFMRLGILYERKADYKQAFDNYLRAYQLDKQDREVAARLARFINRYPCIDSDLAWWLKDALRGGRVSVIRRSELQP